MKNPMLNAEGYDDPTASIAMAAVSKTEQVIDRRASDLVKVLKYITHTAGFEFTERVCIIDTKTGRTYK